MSVKMNRPARILHDQAERAGIEFGKLWRWCEQNKEDATSVSLLQNVFDGKCEIIGWASDKDGPTFRITELGSAHVRRLMRERGVTDEDAKGMDAREFLAAMGMLDEDAE